MSPPFTQPQEQSSAEVTIMVAGKPTSILAFRALLLVSWEFGGRETNVRISFSKMCYAIQTSAENILHYHHWDSNMVCF